MPLAFPETTDLERRVLAHEKLLQALIAYMARTEPRFVDHLRERFVEPMRMARHEHEHRETDDYAEEFIRAVMLLGEARAPRTKGPKVTDEHPTSPKGQERLGPSSGATCPPGPGSRRARNGIWEVKVDGKFRGDYHQKENALAAVAVLNLSLSCSAPHHPSRTVALAECRGLGVLKRPRHLREKSLNPANRNGHIEARRYPRQLRKTMKSVPTLGIRRLDFPG